MDDIYVLAIAALLPATAFMLVTQVNPYHALVIRGILGAIAALVYALLGAADVALTEALVGTMLSITLYAVAVRSSMRMRVGVLEQELEAITQKSEPSSPVEPLVLTLRDAMNHYHLTLEWVTYPNAQTLQAALESKEIHTILLTQTDLPAASQSQTAKQSRFQIQTRVPRLFEIMQNAIQPNLAHLTLSTSQTQNELMLHKGA